MNERRARIRKAVRVLFVSWAIASTLWLANSVRTRGVDESVLASSASVIVVDGDTTLDFIPAKSSARPALIFFCGSGVAAPAYAPLLRPIAEAGHAVFIVRLPYRFAPFDSHKRAALERASAVMRNHREVSRWVVAGHSLGAALAARMIRSDPAGIAALVLVATTHPKNDDLSSLTIPVAKVYGSRDGVAPPARIHATRHLLPRHTAWVEIRGANHSQFGHYGHQLLDGRPGISREEQQARTRSVLLRILAGSDAVLYARPATSF